MSRLQPLKFLLLSAVIGCSQPGETSGTNTNWLRACDDASMCGGLGCSCGHCTLTCNSDADCAPLGGICSPSEAADLECRATASKRLCLPGCTSSNDCESGQLCHRGTCTHTLTSANCAGYSDALVCEDFEGPLDGYTSAITTGNFAQAKTVATPSGARALEARILVAPSTAYLRADFTPKSTGALTVRAWIQVPVGETSYDLAPLAFWSDQEPAWALRIVAKDGQLEAWSYTTPIEGSSPISVGEWHCVEATIDIADAGHIRLLLDGSTVVDEANIDTLPIGGIEAVAMGSEWAGANATLLLDRVLVGATPAGCWN